MRVSGWYGSTHCVNIFRPSGNKPVPTPRSVSGVSKLSGQLESNSRGCQKTPEVSEIQSDQQSCGFERPKQENPPHRQRNLKSSEDPARPKVPNLRSVPKAATFLFIKCEWAINYGSMISQSAYKITLCMCVNNNQPS